MLVLHLVRDATVNVVSVEEQGCLYMSLRRYNALPPAIQQLCRRA